MKDKTLKRKNIYFKRSFSSFLDRSYDYAEDLDLVSFVELDCGHYIFHYEPELIKEEINAFLHD